MKGLVNGNTDEESGLGREGGGEGDGDKWEFRTGEEGGVTLADE